jgi:hypothetical protein
MQQTLILVAALIVGALGGWLLLDGPALSLDSAGGGNMIRDVSDIEVPGNCAAVEARQFDFWVGEWELTWEGGQGNNVIRPTMGGCVIEENFSAPEGQYFGKSVSTYNANTGVWHQTWVDNNAGYLDFTGGMEGDQMILSREATNAEGAIVIQRMVFYNIEHKQFDWKWERSLDQGASWEALWNIHYERRA